MLMADLSRRGFLTTMSVTTGVGIAGGLGLHKLLIGDGSPATLTAAAEVAPVAAAQPMSPAAQLPGLGAVRLAGPMLIHIRDLASAEIGMMVGTQELVYRDPELVARLLKTAASAAQAEG
jgi:hypothetical protein